MFINHHCHHRPCPADISNRRVEPRSKGKATSWLSSTGSPPGSTWQALLQLFVCRMCPDISAVQTMWLLFGPAFLTLLSVPADRTFWVCRFGWCCRGIKRGFPCKLTGPVKRRDLGNQRAPEEPHKAPNPDSKLLPEGDRENGARSIPSFHFVACTQVLRNIKGDHPE